MQIGKHGTVHNEVCAQCITSRKNWLCKNGTVKASLWQYLFVLSWNCYLKKNTPIISVLHIDILSRNSWITVNYRVVPKLKWFLAQNGNPKSMCKTLRPKTVRPPRLCEQYMLVTEPHVLKVRFPMKNHYLFA